MKEQKNPKEKPIINDVSKSIVDFFQCFLCIKYIVPHPFLCSNKHHMCFKCYDKIEDKKCPLCKEDIQASDTTVREVGQSFRYKCLNDGCNSIFTYDDITEHHRTCPHDPDNIRSGRVLEIQELREQMIQEPVDRNRPGSSIIERSSPWHSFFYPPVTSVER